MKEVASQYSKTIIHMNSGLEGKDDRIAQLELLHNMKKPATLNLEEHVTERIEDETFDREPNLLSGTERSGGSNTNAVGLYMDPKFVDTERRCSKKHRDVDHKPPVSQHSRSRQSSNKLRRTSLYSSLATTTLTSTISDGDNMSL